MLNFQLTIRRYDESNEGGSELELDNDGEILVGSSSEVELASEHSDRVKFVHCKKRKRNMLYNLKTTTHIIINDDNGD